MKKIKHSKIGTISFLLSLIPIVYFIIQFIVDLSTPIKSGFNKSAAISFFIMNFVFAVALASFTLGIVALTQKDYKKGLPLSSIIISGIILLIPLISYIKSIIEIINMWII